MIEHIERYLGEIDQGWKDDNSSEGLQVVFFRDCPSETVTTFLSLGLSEHVLWLQEDKEVRQELVFSVYSLPNSELVVSLLMSLCEAIIGRGKAVLRGEVIPFSTALVEITRFSAVYCTIPVFFDDEFCSYEGSSPPTVMVCVLPIHQCEVEFIAANGWESFEDLLESKDPDLCSLEREPVI